MNTNSTFDDSSSGLDPQDLPDGTGRHTNESTGAMDMEKRDRFELLSAYLDGEVTATESRQVEEWLKNDASAQRLYIRLLNLRRGLRTLPVPKAPESPEARVEQVLKRVRHCYRPMWIMGSAALADCVIGAVSGLVSGGDFHKQQLAQQQPVNFTPGTKKPGVSTSPLMVALNNPVIEIPKAAIASPEPSVELDQPILREIQPNIN